MELFGNFTGTWYLSCKSWLYLETMERFGFVVAFIDLGRPILYQRCRLFKDGLVKI